MEPRGYRDTEEISQSHIKIFPWYDAFGRNDHGVSMMKCLVEDPRVVSIRYMGSTNNVLHRAVRNNWYGMILQIAKIFSGKILEQQVLEDLLTEKEWGLCQDDMYSSGLDVLGMAIIQGHQSINSLLAQMIRSGDLFSSHPYRRVVANVDSPAFWRNRELNPQGEVLTEILKTSFTTLIPWLGLQQAPNMDVGLSSDDLDLWGMLYPEVIPWMITSLFLPLSDYLILEWCKYWWRFHGSEDEAQDFQDRILLEGENIAFVKYLLQINDSRRTVLHYALADGQLSKSFQILVDRWSDILRRTRHIKHTGASLHVESTSESGFESIEELRSCFGMTDSSERTPLELYFTRMAVTGDSNLELTMRNLEVFRFFQPLNSLIGEDSQPLNGENCGRNFYASIVYEVNGYHFPRDLNSSSSGDFRQTVTTVVTSIPSVTSERRIELMKFLLDFPEFLPDGWTRRERIRGSESLSLVLGLLQYAVLLGDIPLVRLLVKDYRAYDPARINAISNGSRVTISALQLAAEQGSPEMIRILLDSGAFDPCYRDANGDTALHYAARSSGPFFLPVDLSEFAEIPDGNHWSSQCGNLYGPAGLRTVELPMERGKQQEARYQGCLNMLLQAGIDIWQVNNENQVVSVHEDASPEYSLWWYEKLDRETQEQAAKLTAAANAMSVTAALVATASYIGPLQPPLGYGPDGNDPTDKVQADFLSVRVFIVCNTLAFYTALVAIMFSLTPSLPMPQESMLDELKRIRRNVTLALDFLIVAIVTILIAFAAASTAVIPESWNKKGLTGGTLAVGGLMCLVVLALCCVRALRLMFHKSRTLRMFYKRWVFI